MGEESQALTMDDYGHFWDLESIGKIDFGNFLRSLPLLFDEDCVLALDDVMSDDVRAFIAKNEPVEKPAIYALECEGPSVMVTFLPLSWEVHEKMPMHMLMTRENLQQLVDMYDVCVCHLAVYCGQDVLMEFNDVSVVDAQVQIAMSVDEERVKAFCKAVGFKYNEYNVED